jgi:5'-nucleotidase
VSRPHVLLTNDDGVDAVGLDVLQDRLREVAGVTVVAPAEDHSGGGRVNSREATVAECDRGYVLDGTPVDCVAFGLRGLDADPDLVVAGPNPGPNVGMHKLDRSGTVSAAMEAAFLGTPAVAVSTYDPEQGHVVDRSPSTFDNAADLCAFLVREAPGTGVFDAADVLNVNVPRPPWPVGRPRVVDPGPGFDVRVDREGDRVTFVDTFYDPLRDDHPATLLGAETDTDRAALAAGDTAVSPLVVGHDVARDDRIAATLGRYDGD